MLKNRRGQVPSALGKSVLKCALVASLAIASTLAAPQNQPTLQIISPSSGVIVAPGQTLTVSVNSNSPASFQGVALLGDDPFGLVGTISALPGQLSVAIPATGIACGNHTLTVEGTPTSGAGPVFASVLIDVERADFPASLSATLPGLAFESLGERTTLTLLADFTDGTTFQVTGSSNVAYSSSNNAVATVDTFGTVTAVAAGNASITATYAISGQSIPIQIPVNVSPPKLAVSPDSLTFASQSVGTSSTPQQLTLTNVSPDNLSVLALTPSGDFSETDNCIALSPLGPSSACSANITFSPSATGSRTGALSIANSANVVPILISLAGTGTTAPAITGLNPTSGVVGTSVTITGVNFGAAQGTSTVTFNGTTAAPASWSATSILAPVPSGAATGNVVVTVNGVASNGVNFNVTIPAPTISNLSWSSGPVSGYVIINGSGFGSTQASSTVTFNGTNAPLNPNVVYPAGPLDSWSDSSITLRVPSGATTGNVVVTVGGAASNGVLFTVTPPPSITSLSPTSGPVGTSVTVNGANFGTTSQAGGVGFSQSSQVCTGSPCIVYGTPTSWTPTKIVVTVPSGAITGPVIVSIAAVNSNGVSFTVKSK